MSDLTVQAVLTGPLGTLTLDGTNADAYELHIDTKSEIAVSWRKQEASNEWVEGSFTTSAVRENVVETLAVWVNATTSALLEQRTVALVKFLGQLRYTVALTIDGVTHTWTCSPAEYTVSTKHEFQHARTALVTAKVPRLPRKTVTGSFGALTT
jgi:hypothetical protein